MSREVRCDCTHLFTVDESLAGGYAACPRCGRAVAVPGMRDPLWRLLQVGATILWLAGVYLAFLLGGVVVGLAVGLGLAALFFLASRAL